jgi:hypothetical protein
MASSHGKSSVPRGDTLKVMFWNVFEGMGGPNDARLDRVKEIVAECDVVAFSELNKWTAVSFEECFKDHFQHSVFLETKTGFHLGALSKAPIQSVTASSNEPLHHGFLLFKTFSTVFCATHLNPFSSTLRAGCCYIHHYHHHQFRHLHHHHACHRCHHY